MILLFILDIFLYSIYSIHIPLVLLLLPLEKKPYNIIFIMIILLLIDTHYWLLFLAFMLIYFINILLRRNIKLNVYTYLIILVIDFIVYYLSIGLVNI